MKNEEKELLNELKDYEDSNDCEEEDEEEESKGYFFPDFRNFLN